MRNVLTLLTIFFAGASHADEDFSCKLSSLSKYTSPEDESELLIRAGEFKTEAILVTNYGASVFHCAGDSLDTYECYGFTVKPGETPSQLNVLTGGMQAGTVVVHIKLNIFFLGRWAEGSYAPSDFQTRRFSIDSYTINSCE